MTGQETGFGVDRITYRHRRNYLEASAGKLRILVSISWPMVSVPGATGTGQRIPDDLLLVTRGAVGEGGPTVLNNGFGVAI
jgi:hypothetical protein